MQIKKIFILQVNLFHFNSEFLARESNKQDTWATKHKWF